MTKNEIPIIAKQALSEYLEEPGSVLDSSHETLKPSDIYLLGFNPGGANGKPVEQSISSMLTNTTNAYLDESWENQKVCGQVAKPLFKKEFNGYLKALGSTPEMCVRVI